MKNFLLILFLPVFAVAQKTKPVSKAKPVQKPVVEQVVKPHNHEDKFVLNGVITGLPDSTMVFISHPMDATKIFAVDYSKKGKFSLSGHIHNTDVYQLSFIGYPEVKELFLDNYSMTITGDVKALKKLKVTGSSVHTDYELYQSRFYSLKNSLNEIAGNINKLPPGFERDSLISKFQLQKQKVVQQVDRFVKEKPSSLISAYIIFVTSPIAGDIAALEGRFNKLKPAAKASYYGSEIQKTLTSAKLEASIGKVGSMSIDFTQADTSNVPVSLSSFKGKYVLVDFWASWCGPCRRENPAVVAAYNAYKDKNFTILGVSLDLAKDRWVQAIKDDNLTWTHVSDLKQWQNAAALLYRIQGIPANMLIDPNGKIIARDLRGETLHDMLGKILK